MGDKKRAGKQPTPKKFQKAKMKIPIIIFHHGVFAFNTPDNISPVAIDVAYNQVKALQMSGLLDAASEFNVGINGGSESEVFVSGIFPKSAIVEYHGLDSANENLTICMIEKRVNLLSNEAYIFYEHQKGSSHPINDPLRTPWRECMTRHTVTGWRHCVAALDAGYEACGCHWMTPPKTPPTQFIFAGNFWWAKASFLKTLPSIYERDRIKISGIKSIESRYESEVWLGNGPRPPKVLDFHPGWDPSKVATCR